MNKEIFEDVEVKDFCCLDCFINKVISLKDGISDTYGSVTVVANGDFIEDLFKNLLIKDDFSFAILNFDSVEYCGEYYLSINTNNEIFIEPAFGENRYLDDDADFCLIHEDCNYEILDHVYADEKVIFGIEN